MSETVGTVSANSLLRSAYQIALRKGVDTNWEAFEKQTKEFLETCNRTNPPYSFPSTKRKLGIKSTVKNHNGSIDVFFEDEDILPINIELKEESEGQNG